MPWLFNLRNRLPGCRRAGRALARRVGGAFAAALAARHLLARRADAGSSPAATRLLAAAKAVVLFVDTFNGHFESENAVAAVRVLQAAGYTVHAARARAAATLCCGRTYCPRHGRARPGRGRGS